VHPNHKPWLVVKGTGDDDFYIDHCHPFGASSASSNAGMIGNAIIDIWLSEGVGPVVKYEDDCNIYRIPVSNGPFKNGTHQYAYDKHEAGCRISSLRVPWHEEEGDPDFLFTQVYIGFFWDLPNRSVSLPPAKLVVVRERLRIFLDRYEGHQCLLREVDRIHGTLCHIAFVYLDGRSRLASLSNFAASFKGDEHILQYSLKSMISDLKWWPEALSEPTPHIRVLRPHGPLKDMHIYVDASTSWGIGIIIGDAWAAFRLKDNWKIPGRDICWLEALAIELLLYILEARRLHDADLLVHSDSEGAIGAFEKGRCPNWHINLVLRRSFPVMSRLSISPSLRYIESAKNPADPISRGLLRSPISKISIPVNIPPKILDILTYV